MFGTASVKSRVMSSATTALVTSTTGEAAVTTTVAVTLPIVKVISVDAVCLTDADQDVGLAGHLEALQLDGHHVLGGGLKGTELRQTLAVSDRDARGCGVLRRRGDRGAWDRQADLIGHHDTYVPGRGDLCPGRWS